MIKEFARIEARVFKFNDIALAQTFVDRAISIWMIVLGDDNKYWVATPVDTARLEEAGYEVL